MDLQGLGFCARDAVEFGRGLHGCGSRQTCLLSGIGRMSVSHTSYWNHRSNGIPIDILQRRGKDKLPTQHQRRSRVYATSLDQFITKWPPFHNPLIM